jgi:2-C-methyl-D-erythritol 2,4-cyclodiphosphate synthase
MPEFRIGHGVDLHRLVSGRRCVLGGVEIESPLGPEGHSDADVILHALMDALLGAVGESDIGTHFPNTDPRYKDSDSKTLLSHVWNLVKDSGYNLANCDICVVAEVPKLKPHIAAMKEEVAKVLSCSPEQIGIKATTAEGLGAIGRREGIFASATVLLTR